MIDSARRNHINKIFFILFFVIISIPYFLHLSQDLSREVSWDEATQSLNAKDIILFGPASIKDDRSSYILFPFKTLLGLISFSVFGVSLASLRLPFILFSVLGNALFFSFIRKMTNTLIAVMVTLGFVFYPVRLAMGKSGMCDALVLSLLLIVLWLLGRGKGNIRIYFWLGILSMLITWIKFDNIASTIFLTGFCFLRSYQEKKEGNPEQARRIFIYYSLGAGIISALAVTFYTLVGWRNTIFWIKYLTKGPSWTGFVPCSLQLLWQNIAKLYLAYPDVVTMATFCLVLFLGTLLFSKESRHSPLTYGIFFFVFLLFGKLYISVLFFDRRFTPCLALPFLLMAHNLFFLIVVPINAYLDKNRQLSFGKIKAINFAKSLFILLPAWVLIYFAYSTGKFDLTRRIIFQPSYKSINVAKEISSLFAKTDKVLFLDGCFGYFALETRNKFIDITPDLNASSLSLVESNPSLAKKMILQDRQIKFVLFTCDNLEVKEMLEKGFPCWLVVSDWGILLYRIAAR